MRRFPLSSFTTPYKSVKVNPGERKVIWEFIVPPEYILFVDRLYIFWLPNIVNYFYIDGNLVEVLKRQIGDVTVPERIDPPYVVRGGIKIETYNGSGRIIVAEAIVDGYLVPIEDLRE